MSLPRKKSTLSSSGSLTKLSASNHATNFNNVNKSKKGLTKPDWNFTQTNIDQLKLSQEELERRKVSHQSKNLEVIKNEKQRQSILKTKKPSHTQQLDSKAQLALLKEILFDDDQFKNILLKSDATLKNAANLIENDNLINKKTAKINFTSAPNADLDESALPQETIKKQTSKTTIQNLNSSSDTENNENVGSKLSIDDLIKYRQYLMEKKNTIETQQKNKKQNPAAESTNHQSLDELEKYLNTQINDDLLIRMMNDDDKMEIGQFNKPVNDTTKINRIKSRIQNEQQYQAPTQAHPSTGMNLNDFKKVLSELENQLIEYEETTGRQQSAQRIAKNDNFSSYTISLMNVVSSLLHHLKQTTLDLQNEKQKFLECAKQLDIHRKLIDGLTTEVLTVKTQNEKIINQFATYHAKMETEFDQLRLNIRSTSAAVPLANLDTILLKQNSAEMNKKFQQQQQNQSASKANSFVPQQRSLISPANTEQVNDYDRFSERLNAMLQTDIIPGTIVSSSNNNSNSNSFRSTNTIKAQQSNLQFNDNRPLSSLSRRSVDVNENVANILGPAYYDFDSFLSMQQQSHPISSSANNSRPTSAQPLSHHQHQLQSNNLAAVINTNKLAINEFNTQIKDLSMKNFEAQQKLKNLQQNQELNGQIDNEYTLKFPESMQHFESIENQQTLNKLKEDQHLLKEQILLLNKQRESAQKELSKIVTSNPNTIASLNAFSVISTNTNNRSSPNLSPIPTEVVFQDGLDLENGNYFMQYEVDQLEITPPRKL